VQGPRAPAAISTAIGDLCRRGVDVVVLARGGGSFEDLLPFSDERVVRAVAGCTVPVVSAIGHEQDMPLCDLAADVRASTPTAAARLVVPDVAELRARLARSRERLHRGAYALADRHAARLDGARERLHRAPLLALERRRARLDTLNARLGALSPAATLDRGYAIVRTGDRIVRAAEEVTTGDAISVQVADGTFGATVD
jgi:exodeoxyribonuclease VII large subunit